MKEVKDDYHLFFSFSMLRSIITYNVDLKNQDENP